MNWMLIIAICGIGLNFLTLLVMATGFIKITNNDLKHLEKYVLETKELNLKNMDKIEHKLNELNSTFINWTREIVAIKTRCSEKCKRQRKISRK